METRLIAVKEARYRVEGQTDAYDTNEVAFVIQYPMINGNGDRVAVRQVGTDIGFVRRFHILHAEKPFVARFVFLHRFQYAVGVVILVRTRRHQEAGVGTVFLFEFFQIAHDLRGVIFAMQYPVTQKGVMRHQRRNEYRSQQVFLDFRINIVTGERQCLFGKALPDRVA